MIKGKPSITGKYSNEEVKNYMEDIQNLEEAIASYDKSIDNQMDTM